MKKGFKEKKRKSKGKKIIVISAICLLVLVAAGFFLFENFAKRDFRYGNHHFPINSSERGGNFQPINETTKNQITSFFESSPSSSEVTDYCSKTPMYCMYYCRTINPNDESCSGIITQIRNMSAWLGVPKQ